VRHLIVAHTYVQAQEWAYSEQLLPAEWRFIRNGNDIRGYAAACEVQVDVLPGWSLGSDRDYQQKSHALNLARAMGHRIVEA